MKGGGIMSTNSLLPWLKTMYLKAKSCDLEWKNIYSNNMPCNGIEGIYTDMFFEKDGKYTYWKFSIEYMARCDSEGTLHPKDGIKYYVLHELNIDDLEETFQIPEPSDKLDLNDDLRFLVNDYGNFKYVFDDVETAKSAAQHALLGIIYPYIYILTEEECIEWKEFIKSQST